MRAFEGVPDHARNVSVPGIRVRPARSLHLPHVLRATRLTGVLNVANQAKNALRPGLTSHQVMSLLLLTLEESVLRTDAYFDASFLGWDPNGLGTSKIPRDP